MNATHGITRHAIEITDTATGTVVDRIEADRDGQLFLTSLEARLFASRRRLPMFRPRDGRKARVVVIDGE